MYWFDHHCVRLALACTLLCDTRTEEQLHHCVMAVLLVAKSESSGREGPASRSGQGQGQGQHLTTGTA